MSAMQLKKATSSDGKMQPQYGAKLTAHNQTLFALTLDRHISWFGTPVRSGFPANIMPNGQAMFDHLSDGDLGSKAAVVYKGINLDGWTCAWVLAWEATAESTNTPNKVFVACGQEDLIDQMSFDEILTRLDRSAGDDNVIEPHSKTNAAANIHDLVPNVATVDANFGLMV